MKQKMLNWKLQQSKESLKYFIDKKFEILNTEIYFIWGGMKFEGSSSLGKNNLVATLFDEVFLKIDHLVRRI